ncbi:MAG: DUF86 domain-containing protein [Burkholderiales bacterium]|nr:DUF86 domain-containing protein [Burkholderiales bacterium]
MQPDARDAAHLWDMLSAGREAFAIVDNVTMEQFLADRLRLRALERTLELVGEAARRVTPACQDAHPEIPWRALIGQRNLLAHEYGRINPALLYVTARERAPQLIVLLDGIVGGE